MAIFLCATKENMQVGCKLRIRGDHWVPKNLGLERNTARPEQIRLSCC